MSSAHTSPTAFLDAMNEGPARLLPLASLRAPTFNPRSVLQGSTAFTPEALQELTESIRVSGLLQPLLVREVAHERYEVIAGERRFHAARLAGLREVPVLVRTMTDGEALEYAIVENSQRENLPPDAVAVLAVRSVGALTGVPASEVVQYATRLKNGSPDEFDVTGHLRRLFRMSVSGFAQRYAKVALLTDEERTALLGGRYGLHALVPLTRVADGQQRQSLLHRLLRGDLTAESLAREVQGLQRPPSSSQQPVDRQLRQALPQLRQLQGPQRQEAERLMAQLLSLVASG